MKLLVWGLGYVGTVSAVCLADSGHECRRDRAQSGEGGDVAVRPEPHQEHGLEALLSQAVAAGRLRGSTDPYRLRLMGGRFPRLRRHAESAEGSAQLDALLSVAGEIGRQLAEGADHHVVIVRSTVFPGGTPSAAPSVRCWSHAQGVPPVTDSASQ